MKRILTIITIFLSGAFIWLSALPAAAATPPQCTNPLDASGKVYTCHTKGDNQPSSTGKFEDDTCYTLKLDAGNKLVYFPEVNCNNPPFNGSTKAGTVTATCNDGQIHTSSSGSPTATCSAFGGVAGLGPCKNSSFLGLKPWYAYLPLKDDCSVNIQLSDSKTGAQNLNQLWLIAMAVFEDLLRIAALVAFGFVIYGGFRYITSQGEPEHIKSSLSTIVNALIGLAITILAAVLVGFIAGRLGAS